ncbi:MAG TPA: Rieske 2Fe-2S domain-containing protein [Verrucomicrobiae bacterium]|jgi:nitrite reductase/ring-hydroxylating ferredoxin subunit/multimeric flavodoxin WrbA|nr:Rieske 2Fe-2S domain-containing protein [Verrucomicrobiae bacterium]
MTQNNWEDLGLVENFQKKPLNEVHVRGKKFAVSYQDGKFGAISGVCNHAGGPLGKGRLENGYIVCPWHNWKYQCRTGKGEPGYEDECVPSYEVRVENGHLFLNPEPLTKRNRLPHAAHPLARPVQREKGGIRVAGISTTVMDRKNPRYSTSEALLQIALDFSAAELGCETKMIRLDELHFRSCEGYYSKSAHACTWPCSITQMDKKDELTPVYEALVHWADVILIGTPIRWGSASSLYYKMAERLNCIQNQITINNRVLIQNKVASFIITGGQDNIQAVAGQLLMFFSELGFQAPAFPFIAHSRGWSAEDMERNIDYVENSRELRNGARELARRSVDMAKRLLLSDVSPEKIERGGRKAHKLENI